MRSRVIILLIFLLPVIFMGCQDKKDNEGRGDKHLDIFVDFSKRSWFMDDGDSVWISDQRYISNRVDSPDSLFYMQAFRSEDTIVRLLNLKPVVIILGRDTIRKTFGDTLRYNACKTDTVYRNKVYKINHANTVNIGPNNNP